MSQGQHHTFTWIEVNQFEFKPNEQIILKCTVSTAHRMFHILNKMLTRFWLPFLFFFFAQPVAFHPFPYKTPPIFASRTKNFAMNRASWVCELFAKLVFDSKSVSLVDISLVFLMLEIPKSLRIGESARNGQQLIAPHGLHVFIIRGLVASHFCVFEHGSISSWRRLPEWQPSISFSNLENFESSSKSEPLYLNLKFSNLKFKERSSPRLFSHASYIAIERESLNGQFNSWVNNN